jgi:biopolymer transport protein ExbD
MSYLRKLGSAEVSTGSMADIAFLLLTFFLMTTIISNEKGIMLMFPTWSENPPVSDVHERNVFTVHVNADDRFLVEGVWRQNLHGVKEEIKQFILNYGKDKRLSENPGKAVVSFKTDRETSYNTFIATLDEIQGAYFEIYAERAKLSVKEFRELDLNNPALKKLYDQVRQGIPMNVSMADPVQSKKP